MDESDHSHYRDGRMNALGHSWDSLPQAEKNLSVLALLFLEIPGHHPLEPSFYLYLVCQRKKFFLILEALCFVYSHRPLCFSILMPPELSLQAQQDVVPRPAME
mmetsp:Transcript_27187/g.48053  ORF Transcript_27187/g.48053 Transcript_27187/m.48053 type:complete len:104 (+) Transcript_27187:792-1103(+)